MTTTSLRSYERRPTPLVMLWLYALTVLSVRWVSARMGG